MWSPNFPQKEVARGLVAVPNALTALTSTDTVLFQIVVSNPTAASINFTLQDQQGGGGPYQLFKTTAVDPGVPLVFSVANGVLMKSGIKWQGSASGLVAEVVAVQVG